MGTIGKFKQADQLFIVKTKKTETNSNYNVFCHVFRSGEKMALTGRTFKETTPVKEIMQWASRSIGTPESEEFKRFVLQSTI